MRDATRPIRSLFMYPGYRRVVVDAAMTVDTREFSWFTVGFCNFNLCVESGKGGGELQWYMIYSCKKCFYYFHYTIERSILFRKWPHNSETLTLTLQHGSHCDCHLPSSLTSQNAVLEIQSLSALCNILQRRVLLL
jgi:hypothetical protein